MISLHVQLVNSTRRRVLKRLHFPLERKPKVRHGRAIDRSRERRQGLFAHIALALQGYRLLRNLHRSS